MPVAPARATGTKDRSIGRLVRLRNGYGETMCGRLRSLLACSTILLGLLLFATAATWRSQRVDATATVERFVLASDAAQSGSIRVVLMSCATGAAAWRDHHGDEFVSVRSDGTVVSSPDLFGLSSAEKRRFRFPERASPNGRYVIHQTLSGRIEVRETGGEPVWRVPNVGGYTPIVAWVGGRVATYEEHKLAIEIRSYDVRGRHGRVLAFLPRRKNPPPGYEGLIYAGLFAVSRDERLVAVVRYPPGESGRGEILVVDRIRHESRILKLEPDEIDGRRARTLAFSADGRALDLDFETGGLSRFDLRTGRRREILPRRWGVVAVSPNRRHALVRDGAGRAKVADLDSGKTRPVRVSLGNDLALSVSASGKRALFANLGGAFIVDAATKSVHRVPDSSDGNVTGVAQSPDGSGVAVARLHSVTVVDVKKGTVVRVLKAGPDENAESGDARGVVDPEFGLELLSTPAFSPDGKRLAYLSKGGVRSSAHASLFVADGATVMRISNEAEAVVGWSPDGKWIAVSTIGGFAVVSTARREERNIVSDQSENALVRPVWSADSSRLYVKSEKGIEAVPIDGSSRKPLGFDGKPVELSPDGTRLRYLAALSGQLRSVSLANLTDDRLECARQPGYPVER